MADPLTSVRVRVLAPELAEHTGEETTNGWVVRVAVVDATYADAHSPDVVAVERQMPQLDGAELDIDVPPRPQGRRWELQVHARPLEAGPSPDREAQVRVGDAITMVALPVDGRAPVALEAPVQPVRS